MMLVAKFLKEEFISLLDYSAVKEVLGLVGICRRAVGDSIEYLYLG